MRNLFRVGKSVVAGLVLLAVSALVADRGGFLRLDDVLSVGRQAEQARASQGSCVMPTVGTVSGLTLVNDINTCFAAILTANSGGSAPANGTGAAAMTGQLWLDTSTTPNGVRMYDGTSWNVISYQDAASHVWTPPVGGGTNTLASATTTDIWSLRQAYISVTGTTTITALASASAVAGTVKVVRFTGALTLTHNATSLILPTAANITTAAGDAMVVLALSSTNVAVVGYQKADGTPLNPTASFTGAVSFAGIITPTALTGTNNDWNPTGLSTANRIRASASSAATVTGITAVGTGGTLIIHNVGSFAITLSNANTGSTGVNRFSFIRDATLQPNDSITLIYDITTQRWRVWQSLPLQTAPTVQTLTAGTTYTPTNPGVAWQRIRIIAGGGGGGAQITNPGSTGGTTSFQVNSTGTTWTAVGGSGGAVGALIGAVGGAGGTGGVDGATTNATKVVRLTGARGTTGQGGSGGGNVTGGIGGSSPFGGAGQGGRSGESAPAAAAANTGSGGGGIGTAGGTASAGGGSGEYLELITTGMTTATFAIGGAGAGGVAGTLAGGAGAGGIIIIEENY